MMKGLAGQTGIVVGDQGRKYREKQEKTFKDCTATHRILVTLEIKVQTTSVTKK